MEENNIVKQDRGEDYNHSISKILDEIDMFKQAMLTDPSIINRFKERLDALSVRLWGKMQPEERKRQMKLRVMIAKANPFYSKRTLDEFGEVVAITKIDRKKFIMLKNILEKKEIALNIALERIGLTAKPKEGRRRVT